MGITIWIIQLCLSLTACVNNHKNGFSNGVLMLRKCQTYTSEIWKTEIDSDPVQQISNCIYLIRISLYFSLCSKSFESTSEGPSKWFQSFVLSEMSTVPLKCLYMFVCFRLTRCRLMRWCGYMQWKL